MTFPVSLSRRTLLAAAAVGAGLVPLAGCAASASWRQVSLDAEPQALAALPSGLLVGTSGSGLIGPTGAIAVRTATPYGREAGWVSLAASGDLVSGVGMTHGGAHANPRWSVFSGSVSGGVDEWEQPFDVFHGWGAGQLIGVGYAGDTPAIVGSWQSEASGNDPSVWLWSGRRWERRVSTGTPLASTRTALAQANALAGGDRLVVAGQVIELSPLHTRAVVWTAADPAGEWSRIDLPGDGTTVTAQCVAAHPGGWLVVGVADGRAVAWTIAPDLTVTTLDLPATGGAAITQVRVAASVDGLLVVAGDGAGVHAASGRPGSWQVSTPPGTGPLAAGWASGPMVITAGSPARLFELF